MGEPIATWLSEHRRGRMPGSVYRYILEGRATKKGSRWTLKRVGGN